MATDVKRTLGTLRAIVALKSAPTGPKKEVRLKTYPLEISNYQRRDQFRRNKLVNQSNAHKCKEEGEHYGSK
ncbi:MAG: hypothetical protein IH859_03575 [Chloroflexi bacterium]|nr:hypothetical protein [Chloroflexota bacterium]